MLKKAEMEAVIDGYLKDIKKAGITTPFVPARFAAQIVHSQDRTLTHQNLFVRFIPGKAHKWLAGYIMRGCLKTWGEDTCLDCYDRQKSNVPMEMYESEHATMVKMMKWYWVQKGKKKGGKSSG